MSSELLLQDFIEIMCAPQGENALLRALAEELKEIKRQVTQSQRWKEHQFDMQNRALMAEVTALKERYICDHNPFDSISILDSWIAHAVNILSSILKTKEKIGHLNQAERSPQSSASPTTVEAKRKLSTSIDSLNTSQDVNNKSNWNCWDLFICKNKEKLTARVHHLEWWADASWI